LAAVREYLNLVAALGRHARIRIKVISLKDISAPDFVVG
jgi:hypothetical protein